MKNLEDKLIAIFYAFFGAGLGLLVYMFGLGGWEFVFTGHTKSTLKGPLGLIVSLGIGAVLGLFSYVNKNKEIGGRGRSSFFQDQTRSLFLVKRLLGIAGAF